jgi:[acyl-carrier-protein] S-malonyltransferase
MGRDLAEAYPECTELFARADGVLGYGLSEICFEGPAEELTKTSHCQPGIFMVSVACYAALRKELPDVAFCASAGLSLGEWSALHTAGVLSFDDTLRVLEARGRFMQEACDQTDGAMLSIIGLSVEQIQPICEQSGSQMANLNSAQQTVLSGERAAIEKAAALATEAGAKRAIPLKVAGAYHSALMAPAADKLRSVLEGVEFKSPSLPVVANVTGVPHGDPAGMRETMLQQVTSSVRWQASVEWLQAQGVTEYVECGPGKVLGGLIKRIDKTATVHSVQDIESLKAAAAALA